MRIQLLSDLHFEFHRDRGASLVADCFTPVDVLVLAGDIAVAEGIAPALTMFSERYPQVVYVHGNHEFYGSSRSVVTQLTREVCARLGNVHWLDADVVELGGRRFLGTPLWFPDSEEARSYRGLMNDFAQITDYDAWVYSEHARARAFLETELRTGDVVITHHLPMQASVSERFRDAVRPREQIVQTASSAFSLDEAPGRTSSCGQPGPPSWHVRPVHAERPSQRHQRNARSRLHPLRAAFAIVPPTDRV